jgi:LPXTG-motif cell wall-anchored protein
MSLLKEQTPNVTNDAGVSLPATGGPGTSLIYIIGLTLTGIAGTVLLMRRLKRA